MTNLISQNPNYQNWQKTKPQTSLFLIEKNNDTSKLVDTVRKDLSVKQANVFSVDQSLGIDAIRDVRSLMMLKAGSENRLFVFKNVDEFSPASANALLKSIEEPKQGTFVILTARSLHKVLVTIQSRSQLVVLSNQDEDSINDECIQLAKQYYTAKPIKRMQLNLTIKDDTLSDFLRALLKINHHLIRRDSNKQLDKFISSQETVVASLDALQLNANKKLLKTYLAVNL